MVGSKSKVEINPKIHKGPFSVNCLFMEGARDLMVKIEAFLHRKRLSYRQTDPFTLKIKS